MNIKLTPFNDTNPKDGYEVVVYFEHGDADGGGTVELVCTDKEEFIKMMTAMDSRPKGGRDEAAYWDWCEENFGEGEIPHDATYGPDTLAYVRRVEGFYYDENGVKFRAELA